MPEAAVRSIWSGTLTFGLVSIPVDLFAAVQGRQTAMKMADTKGRALGREYYSDEHEEALGQEDLVRGYETEKGKMVVLTDDELESVAPEMTRDIELRVFVPKQAVSPAYFQRPYFLAPSGRSQKAYQLLARVMQKTGRVGVGTFVLRGHQHLVAVISEGNILRAETLRFAAELRSPKDVGLPKRVRPPAKQVKRFSDAIDALASEELDPKELADRYAEAIRELVEEKARKRKGVVRLSGLEAEEQDDEAVQGNVIDLMKLLKQRVAATSSKRPARQRSARRPHKAG